MTTLRIAILTLLALAYGCKGSAPVSEPGTLVVLATLPPLAHLVERIGGDVVQVTTLVPEGQSPHTYEPVPSQLVSASQAVAWFQVGSGIEFERNQGEALRQTSPEMAVVDCHRGIELLSLQGGAVACEHHGHDHHHHDHGTVDPHVWVSPANLQVLATNVAAALETLDPARAATFAEALGGVLADVAALQQDLQARPLEGRAFLAYHPSFSYFAHEYGMRQLAIEQEGRQPGPAGVAAVVDQAREAGLDVVVTSPQFDASSAEVIAAEIDGRVVAVDPLAADVLGTLRTLADAVAPAP